jgi:hypothetical protein
MTNKIPLGDEAAILPNTPLSHAQAVAAIERPVGVSMNAKGGIERRPVSAAKCIKQNLLLPHIRSGLGSNRLRPAISVRLQLLCHGGTKIVHWTNGQNKHREWPVHGLFNLAKAGNSKISPCFAILGGFRTLFD